MHALLLHPKTKQIQLYFCSPSAGQLTALLVKPETETESETETETETETEREDKARKGELVLGCYTARRETMAS